MKLVAEIAFEKIEDNIKFLIIESDKNDTKGYFLFFHKSIDTPCEADLWFKDIDAAKRQGTFNYGINPNNWVIYEP